MVKIFLLRLFIESGMTAGARLTFQFLEASYAGSKTTGAWLTIQCLGASPLPNWIREILFGFTRV